MRTVALLVLAAPVCAHDVHVVSSTPPDFPTIQAAVDAAADGDAVVVRPGTYAGFTLAGKGVSVVGSPLDGVRPRITSKVVIQGLAAAQTAVVRGFDLDQGDSIELSGNDGAVQVEDFGGFGTHMEVTDSLDVVLVRTHFYTLDSHGSALHAYEVDVSGGSDGVTALRVIDGFAFLSGSKVVGGMGYLGASGSIFWPLCSDGGPGGIGLYVQNAQVYRLETVIAGGSGGPPGVGKLGPTCLWGPSGPAVSGSGSLVDVPGTARDFEISSPGVESESVHLRAEGAAGEFVYVLVGSSLDPLWFPPWRGSVAVPFTSPLLFLGVVPAWEEIQADVNVGELGPGLEGVELFAQAAFVSLTGGVVVQIGPPSAVELLDHDAILVDCNGNGVQDSTDIATGTSLDCNGNGKPDECDIALGGVSKDCNANGVPDECDIASGASHDGNENGQPDECDSAPLIVPDAYPTIQAAIAAASPKGTVLVRDGVYSGPGFQSLWVDKDVVVLSQHGPEATVLTAPGAGTVIGFTFEDAPETAAVKGFTLRGFSTAIRVIDSNAKVQDCVIEDGSDVAMEIDIGCAPPCLPASEEQHVRVEGCTFKNNQGSPSGAIRALSWVQTLDLTVSGCLFSGNVGEQYSQGAISLINGNLTLLNSAFVANSSPESIILHAFLEDSVGYSHIQGVTIAGNDSGSIAALVISSGSSQPHDVLIANSIIRGNHGSGAGYQVSLQVPSSKIEWTNVPPDLVQVFSGSLTYGPGMLDVNPLFAGLAAGDVHLSAASPCIDAGDPAYVPLPGETDFDGQARVFGQAIDMGADEFHP